MHRPSLAAVTLLTLAGCGIPAPTTTATTNAAASSPAVQLDREGRWACQDFASGVRQAVTPEQRGHLAAKVLKWAPSSQTPGIATGAAVLGRSWDRDATWQLASDTFAGACLAAGFKG